MNALQSVVIMDRTSDHLCSLIGSRICHDLISPLGAIANGLELVQLSHAAAGPEMDLISDSVRNATARVRFFRVAFGAARDGVLGADDARAILAELEPGARVSYQWDVTRPLDRSVARLAFLAILCVESALPFGGAIRIEEQGARITVRGHGARMQVEHTLWSALSGAGPLSDVRPAQVEFLLLPQWASDAGQRISVEATTEAVALSIGSA